MTPEQIFLLTCLSDFCGCRKTDKPEYKIDEEVLFRLSDAQSLSSLLYAQCREWMDNRKQFHNSFLSDIFLSVNRAEILSEICGRFKNAEIPFICMKGSVFRNYWPVPELRSMGDTDIIIHTGDREKANDIFLNDMGFKRMIDNHAVWTYWLGKIEFEVHDHMFYECLANSVDYIEYFDEIWTHIVHDKVFGVDSDYLFVPEDNIHFLYLMAHTAKHIINGGVGFRAFMDMVFITRQKNLDWIWLEKELRKLKLYNFTEICFALCRKWFGTDMPLESSALSDEFFESVTEKMFRDGVFGLNNEDNIGAHSAKEIRRSVCPYWITAIILTFKKIFPPYKDMQLIPWYSWVDGKPWLMPAAWIYRWFYCAVHKLRHSKELIEEPFTKRKIIEKRESLIKDWGL